ncbi:putative Tryptophan--tRNA ligase [Blattamonas nauphoetae]|uniref:tryptophan--tRNA ligase n=1 Tax=Blattamonas nauphoetae TaxID=2049346 RepID=A0ABQ9X5G2_9EUKA|nr:putative Tryptophan--tRNA ligase [Blattamonas nauphoetae]
MDQTNRKFSMSEENKQTLEERCQELEAKVALLQSELDRQKPTTINVIFKGKNSTFTIPRSSTVESLGKKIKDATGATTVPTLYFNGKAVTDDNNLQEILRESKETCVFQCELFTPWDVVASEEKGVDYDGIVHRFGLTHVTSSDLDKFVRITNTPLHPWLERGFFFCAREFRRILDTVERGDHIYLYTGRGPSSDSLHLGHMIQFHFAKYLQDAFNCIIVIQMSNDEKFIFKKNLSLDEVAHMTRENAKDIIACGFNPDRTFIFSDLDYIGNMYRTVLTFLKNTSAHTESKIYGFDDQSPVGFYTWPCIQAAPAFSCSFPTFFGPPVEDSLTNTVNGPSQPLNLKEEKEDAKKKKGKKQGTPASPWAVPCLIPCAIDQDPYFRMSRELAPTIGFPPPATLLSSFVPSLSGGQTKMSASATQAKVPTTIFMSDNDKTIDKAINGAFSIGSQTLEEHRKNGAAVKDLQQDAAFSYLSIYDHDSFMDELDDLGEMYLYGEQNTRYPGSYVTSGILKNKLKDVIKKMAKTHQENRAKVTEEEVNHYLRLRTIDASLCGVTNKPRMVLPSFTGSFLAKKSSGETVELANASVGFKCCPDWKWNATLSIENQLEGLIALSSSVVFSESATSITFKAEVSQPEGSANTRLSGVVELSFTLANAEDVSALEICLARCLFEVEHRETALNQTNIVLLCNFKRLCNVSIPDSTSVDFLSLPFSAECTSLPTVTKGLVSALPESAHPLPASDCHAKTNADLYLLNKEKGSFELIKSQVTLRHFKQRSDPTSHFIRIFDADRREIYLQHLCKDVRVEFRDETASAAPAVFWTAPQKGYTLTFAAVVVPEIVMTEVTAKFTQQHKDDAQKEKDAKCKPDYNRIKTELGKAIEIIKNPPKTEEPTPAPSQ